MTRLQKKCFFGSVAMHSLLLVILIASAAFRPKPTHHDMDIVMTMVNLPVTDQQGVGGGSPAPPAPASQPQAVVSVPQQAAPRQTTVARSTPTPTRTAQTPPLTPRKVEKVEEQPLDQSDEGEAPAPPKKVRKPHEIKPTFDSITPETHKQKTKIKPTTEEDHSDADAEAKAEARAQAAANARANRIRRELSSTLDNLPGKLKNIGAQSTEVGTIGQNGGPAFVGYETYIFNAYYRAWITPENLADRLASVNVKIVVARDGSILSAEIVNSSGHTELDRSVEKALRAVTHLPPFPTTAKDEQRTFKLRFNLQAKEGNG